MQLGLRASEPGLCSGGSSCQNLMLPTARLAGRRFRNRIEIEDIEARVAALEQAAASGKAQR